MFFGHAENAVRRGHQKTRDVHLAVGGEKGTVQRGVHADAVQGGAGPDGMGVLQRGVVVENTAGLLKERVFLELVLHQAGKGEQGGGLAQDHQVGPYVQGLAQGQGAASHEPALSQPLEVGPFVGVGRARGGVLLAGVHHVRHRGAVQKIHRGLAVQGLPDFDLGLCPVEKSQVEGKARVLQRAADGVCHVVPLQEQVVPAVQALGPDRFIEQGHAHDLQALFGLGDDPLPQEGPDAAHGGGHGSFPGHGRAVDFRDLCQDFAGQRHFHGHFQDAEAGGR